MIYPTTKPPHNHPHIQVTDFMLVMQLIETQQRVHMRTNNIGLTSPDKTVWWKVDLGGVYSIYSINLLFKSYDGYGMYFVLR